MEYFIPHATKNSDLNGVGDKLKRSSKLYTEVYLETASGGIASQQTGNWGICNYVDFKPILWSPLDWKFTLWPPSLLFSILTCVPIHVLTISKSSSSVQDKGFGEEPARKSPHSKSRAQSGIHSDYRICAGRLEYITDTLARLKIHNFEATKHNWGVEIIIRDKIC